MDDLGNRGPKYLVEFFILFGLLLRIFTVFQFMVSELEVGVIFEAIGVAHPWEGLSVGASWLLEFEGLIEGIDDADEEILPQLLDILLLAGLGPLNRGKDT